MKFRNLNIGDTFDFVHPNPDASPTNIYNSFFARCTKVSKRCYTFAGQKNAVLKAQVGTINCNVYHVIQGA
jgi:hypothetical protein